MTLVLPLWMWTTAFGILATVAFFQYRDDLPRVVGGFLARIGLVDHDLVAKKIVEIQERRYAEWIVRFHQDEAKEAIKAEETRDDV